MELGSDQIDFAYGNDTTLSVGDFTESTIYDASNKPLRGAEAWINGSFCPRLASAKNAVRIYNLGSSANKLTVDLMQQALQTAEENEMTPNAIFMTPRSRFQLRDSMQSNNTNTTMSAPSNFEDIPIISTNRLSNDEGASV